MKTSLTNYQIFPGFQTIIKSNNNLLFPFFLGNGLCRYKNGLIELVGEFPVESQFNSISLFGNAGIFKNELYFVPHSANSLVFFNEEEDSFRSEEIRSRVDCINNFFNTTADEDSIWLFPTRYPGIMQIDLKNHKQIVFDDWCKHLYNFAKESEIRFSKRGFVRRNQKTFCCSAISGIILEFDLLDKSYLIHKFDTNGIAAACDDGENIWLIPSGNDSLISWNPISGYVKEYEPLYDGFRSPEVASVISIDGKIFVFPYVGGKVKCIDIESGHVEDMAEFDSIISEEKETKTYKWESDYLGAEIIDNNTILFCTGRKKRIYEYKVNSKTISKPIIKISDRLQNKLNQMLFCYIEEQIKLREHNNIVVENEIVNCDVFLKYIKGIESL